MSDDPTNKTSDSEPSGVGFAALNLGGQPTQPTPPMPPPPGPTSPPPGPPNYNPSYAPPPPPPPPGAVYRYDYSRMPQGRSIGTGPLLLIGLFAFAAVLVLGLGGLYALGMGPFHHATSVPTLIAQATPTNGLPTPTQPPFSINPSLEPSPVTTGPTPTPVPSGDVTDALLSHIPLAIEPTCFTVAGSDTIVAIATCSADDGNIQLIYMQYADADSMNQVYEGYRLASQIEPDTGDCSDHDSWPAENGFNISGQPAGRWLCTDALGGTSIYWTDDRLNILSQATQTVPDYSALVDFWLHDSGPNLQPFSN